MTREAIVSEIRRTAEANGGTPLGVDRFASETGIRERAWRGRYWARWSEALEEAGFAPNVFSRRYDDDDVLARLVGEIRRLGRWPVEAELSLARTRDDSFPSHHVFRREHVCGQVSDLHQGRRDCHLDGAVRVGRRRASPNGCVDRIAENLPLARLTLKRGERGWEVIEVEPEVGRVHIGVPAAKLRARIDT